MVDSVKNYGVTGVSANVELGKKNVTVKGTSDKVQLEGFGGGNARAQIEEGTADSHAVTYNQMHNRINTLPRVYSNVVSYNSGTTNMMTVRANTTVLSVSVEALENWTSANTSTNIIVGDNGDDDRLFTSFDPTVSTVDETNHTYSEQTTIKSRVSAGSASGGTAKIIILYAGGKVLGAPQQTIDTQTEINIFFDSSGSMNSTLSPLTTMRNEKLKEAILPFYDNNETIYNQNVTITNIGNERVFDQMRTMGSSANVTQVINLVFSDENSPYGAVGSYPTNRTSQYDTDMSNLRSDIASANSANTSSYYRSVLFQVDTGPGSYGGYKTFTQAVYNGTGNYSGTNGLESYEGDQVYLVNDVIAGSNATYYANQIISSLNNLGYDLPTLEY